MAGTEYEEKLKGVVECKKDGCDELMPSGARGGYCKEHAKPRKQKTQCRVCGRYFLVKPDHHGPCKIEGKVHCYACVDAYNNTFSDESEDPEPYPKRVAERRESPKIETTAKAINDAFDIEVAHVRIFEEELKARIGYEVLEQFECCNTCHSRAGELCNKWYPNTFKHGAFEAKCRYYTKGGS